MRCSLTLSDAGVPGVAAVTGTVPVFGRRRAQALAQRFRAIGHGDAGDIFDALVPELPGNAKSKGSAEADGKLTAVHAVGNESLRVQRVGHVDAFPPVGLNRTVDNISGVGENPRKIQDVRQRHADPFGNVRPALLARQMSDLAAYGKLLSSATENDAERAT